MNAKHARREKRVSSSRKKVNIKNLFEKAPHRIPYDLPAVFKDKENLTALDIIKLPVSVHQKVDFLNELYLIDPVKRDLLRLKYLEYVASCFSFWEGETLTAIELLKTIATRRKNKKGLLKLPNKLLELREVFKSVEFSLLTGDVMSEFVNLYLLIDAIIRLKTGEPFKGERDKNPLWEKILKEITL